jgi:hypothetical protein
MYRYIDLQFDCVFYGLANDLKYEQMKEMVGTFTFDSYDTTKKQF